MQNQETVQRIDHLFRHEYGNLVSILTRRFGSTLIEQVEDSVQDALYKAMQLWPYKGIPDNPSAWLYTVSYRHLIDTQRQLQLNLQSDEVLAQQNLSTLPDEGWAHEIQDGQLRMIFACCHPALSVKEQIMLSLKLLGGLSIREISKAFLKPEEATKKAVQRARAKFRQAAENLEVPVGKALGDRVERVLKVVYLLFTEGYRPSDGDLPLKKDIISEAIRLGLLLRQHEPSNTTKLSALLAIMHLKAARLEARIGSSGQLVPLAEQSRRLWNQDSIQRGFFFLAECQKSTAVEEYMIEASIDAHYCMAKSYKAIDWQTILSLYNVLLKIKPSPMVSLSRAIPLMECKGPKAALQELDVLSQDSSMLNNHYYFSIRTEVLLALRDLNGALSNIRQAILLVRNQAEKRHLESKQAKLLANLYPR